MEVLRHYASWNFAGHLNFQLVGLNNRPIVMYPIGKVKLFSMFSQS